MNYPVFSSAQTDGATTTLHGTVSGAPGSSLTVQVFSSPTPDPSGFGEGLSLVGDFETSTDSQGQGGFDVGLPPSGPGSYISATATDGAGNTSEFSPVVTARAVTDLKVTISANPDPVGVGGLLTYSIAVTNVGILDAHNVILTDTLPGQVTLVSATSSQGRTPFVSSQGIGAALGTIPGGASASVIVIVQVQAQVGQFLSDSAQAALDELDANPADNSATATTRVAAVSDLAVSLSATPSPIDLESNLTFTVTATNTGPSRAGHVIVTLPLPPALGFSSAITTQGAASFADGQLTANLGNLDPGSQVTITVIAQAIATGSVSTTAVISSDAFDPVAANNSATAEVSIAPIADLAVAIQTTPGPVADGQQVVYTVVASNTGGYLATGVTLVNVLPAGVNFLSASNDQGAVLTMVAGAVTSFIGELAPGETATLSITAQVACPAGTTLVDTAKLSATEDDPTPADNWATATTPVRDPSDLSVTMKPRREFRSRRPETRVHPGRRQLRAGRRTRCEADDPATSERDARHLFGPLRGDRRAGRIAALGGPWTAHRDRQRDDRSRRPAWSHGGRPVDPRCIGPGREREPRPGQRSGIGHRGRDPGCGPCDRDRGAGRACASGAGPGLLARGR